jgi:hypothetical protein
MRAYVVRFVDSTKVDWSVSEEPSGFGGLRDWDRRRLRFESAFGVRYFRPVPENWQDLSSRVLESLCALADLAETAA